jgi:hypothetical protein
MKLFLSVCFCGIVAAIGPHGEAASHAYGQATDSSYTAIVPDHNITEGAALRAIRQLVEAPRPAGGPPIEDAVLQQIKSDVDSMSASWEKWLRGRSGAPASDPPSNASRAASLSRSAKALEWALRSGDNLLLQSVAADLATKRQDCDARPEGMFATVKVNIRTLQGGSEKRGLQVRYLERFYWDLLPKVPALAKEWREFSSVSAIVGEQLTAGDYVIVARSADGKDLSDAKPISVGTNKPTQFDLVVR